MHARTAHGRARVGLLIAIAAVAGLLAVAPPSTALGATALAVANPSFETPQIGGYKSVPSGTGWTFAGYAGVQHNGSAFSGSVTAPDGTQTAYLQGTRGTLGTMSQRVTLTAGTYSIAFKAARRWNSIQPIRISVDGTSIGTYTPTGTSFTTVSTANFSATAGPHTILFAATDSSGDRTTFIDAVAIASTGGGTGTGGPTGQPPAAPTGLTATSGTTQAVLNWSATSNTTGYNVYRGTSPGAEATTPIVSGITTPTYTSTGLTNGTTYYFTVRAANAAGVSPASTEVGVTPTNSGSADIDLSRYRLTFADEFNTLSVSAASPKRTATWHAYPPYGPAGNFSASAWTPSALSTSGGVLSNRAYKKDGKWYSGYLSSVDPTGAGFSQLYGYFEARVKMPDSGVGSWPSFWMASTNGIPAVSPTAVRNEEIDVFEWYGTTNQPGNPQSYVQQASHNYVPNASQNPAGSSHLYEPLTRMPGGAYPW